MRSIRTELLDGLGEGSLRREVEYEPMTVVLSANDVRLIRDSIIANICDLEVSLNRKEPGWELYRSEINALNDLLHGFEFWRI